MGGEQAAMSPANRVVGFLPRAVVWLVRTIWRHAWWFVVLAAMVAFALEHYVALIYILASSFAVTVVVKGVTWCIERRTGTREAAALSFHFTPWGIVFIALSFLFIIGAIQTGISLLYGVAGLMAAVMMGSMVLGGFYLSRIEGEWQVPEHLYAGQPFTAKVTVRNRKRVFAAYGLVCEDVVRCRGEDITRETPILYVPPRAQVGIEYEVVVPHRGPHPLAPLVLRSRFPLGVLECAVEVARPCEMLVLPRLGEIKGSYVFQRRSLDQNVLRHSMPQDRQIEFFGLREYRLGDSLRSVHWRTSARRGQLYVREFERQEGKNVLILLDTYLPPGRGPAIERRRENLETAVSFCASLAALLLRNSSFYAFTAFTPEFQTIPYDVGQGHFFHVVETLARVRPNTGHSLPDLLDRVEPVLLRGGLVVAVSLGDLPGLRAHERMGPQCTLINVDSPDFSQGFVFH